MIEDAKDVRERLLSGRPDRDPGVRARRLEELRHGVGDGTPVPPPVESAEDGEPLDDLAREIVQRGRFDDPERVRRSVRVPKGEERVVTECEERPPQRREHAELVVGPLDRRERVAKPEHLLARMKRFSADEDVRESARLEGADVGPGDVLSEVCEPPKEQADVARLDRDRRTGLLALAQGPAALPHEPVHEGADGVGR